MAMAKTVVLGVTGGIAAYKAADLVSRLSKQGIQVHVIMTAAARELVAPLTFRTLSGNPVITGLFEEAPGRRVQHISLAEEADLFAIVPATANIIGKIANGIADDMLSTTVMAARCPVFLAPAMNVGMWENPVLQRNIRCLEGLGYHIMDPDAGYLACGTEGRGRLPGVEKIEAAILQLLNREQDYRGKTVLVTAGPTRESLDPVRFITNHSTGKMGYAIARAARERGAEVILVSGPTNLPDPSGVQTVRVESAREMYQAVMAVYDRADIVVKTAAVADYRPKEVAPGKIKKEAGDLVLVLERNPDILWELGQKKTHQLLVGFAAETDKVLDYAREKLQKKNLDMIVANDIMESGAGFGGETNRVTLLTRKGESIPLPQMSKYDTAQAILDQIGRLPGQVGQKEE